MIAWGFSNGQWTPAQLARRAKLAGYRCASLELDDYGNAARWPEFRDAFLAEGLLPGVWFTDGWNLPQTPADARFTIGELESEGDYQGCLNAIDKLPDIPKAVVTNFTPLTDSQGVPLPEKSAPLIEADYRCLTEAYLGDNPNARPDRLEYTATVKLGWPKAQPIFGVHNKPLADYSQWMQGGYGVYLAEYLL